MKKLIELLHWNIDNQDFAIGHTVLANLSGKSPTKLSFADTDPAAEFLQLRTLGHPAPDTDLQRE